MLPNSAREKGKRFEKYIAQQIELEGFGKATREIGSGSGLKKGDIFCNLDWIIEAKNHKSLNWWESIRQAQSQAKKGNSNSDKWALVIRNPKTPETSPEVLVVIDFWQWLNLLKKMPLQKIKEPDRELKYWLARLILSAKEVSKRVE